jgi:hypothetical protein
MIQLTKRLNNMSLTKIELYERLLNTDDVFRKAVAGAAAAHGMALYRAAMDLAKTNEKPEFRQHPKIRKQPRQDYHLKGKEVAVAIERNKKLRENILKVLANGPATISNIKKSIAKPLILNRVQLSNSITLLRINKSIKSVKKIGNAKLWALA